MKELATMEDVTGLKKKQQELLRQVHRLKDENSALRAGFMPAPEDSEREKFLKANAPRLKPFEPGTAEWQAEFDKIMGELQPIIDAESAKHGEDMSGTVAKQRATIERETVRQAALGIVAKLAKPGSANLLLPHITARLSVKWDGDECVPFFTSADGGEYSEAGLIAEFRNMRPEFALIVEGASEADKLAHARRVAETLGTAAPARQLTRAQFDALNPQAQADAMSKGTKLVDH